MYLEKLTNNRIISCSFDYLIKIWKLNEDNNCELLHKITLHQDIVMKVIAITKGRFASCLFDRSIKIFRDDTYECFSCINEAHSNYIKGMILLDNGLLVSGSKDIKCWNLDNNSCIHTIDKAICYNTETMYQISSHKIILGQYKSILIINIITYQIESIIYSSSMSLNISFAIINDGSLLCANDNEAIYQYDIRSYKAIAIKSKTHIIFI